MVNNSNVVNESAEQEKKKDVVDLKSKFIKWFLFEKDLENNPAFIEQVMWMDEIDVDLKKQLDKFKELNSKEFWTLNVDEIKIDFIKRKIAGDYVKLKTAKNLLFWEVKKTYNINDKILKEIIEKKADWTRYTYKEIYDLISSPRKLEIYVKTRVPNTNTHELEKTFSNFETLSRRELDKIIERNPWKKQEIEEIISRLVSNEVRDDDIRALFEFNILNTKQKKEFIDTYIPTLSLARAVELWLLTFSEAKDKKKSIMEASFKDLKNTWSLNADILRDIVEYTSLEDIVLLSKDLYNDDNINLIAEWEWFRNLEKNFESLKQRIKNDIVQNWIQTFDDLRTWLEDLNTNSRFKNLEKFRVWNIIKMISKDSEDNDVITFIQVTNIDDKRKEFFYKIIWSWDKLSINNKDIAVDSKWYLDFVEWLKAKTNIKFQCFTVDDIKEKINKKELKNLDYKKLWYWDLSQEEKNKFIWELESEILGLEEEIKTNNDKSILDQKKQLLEQKKNNLDLYQKWNDWEKELVFNKLSLIEKIDQIDPDWKAFWFWKWTCFKLKDSETNKEFIYQVDWFEDTITIKQPSSWLIESWISLEMFFDTFKEKKAKRIETLSNFSTLIERNKSSEVNKSNSNWFEHEFINWKLIAKWVNYQDKTTDQEVDYLIWDKTNDIIKINSINWDYVTIQFWERKDFWDIDEKEKKKSKIWEKEKWEKIYLEKDEIVISLNDLNSLISKDNLYPSWKTWKKIIPEPIKNLQNEFKWNIFSRFFKHTSINELLAWWKMLVEWIKETMKKWNDLHAAEFALKIWKILPWDLGQDMWVKVERAQQEQQDKELESLWKVDSWIAVERIEKWLKNKDTPEYKKEAWIIFMLDKYWHLTSKNALYKYRWKWFWYEALGWKINDALFLEKQAEAKNSWITFSEEYLVHMLLKKQCDARNWYYPKRRSRLHKEYENKWKSWVAAEFDKWYSDAEKKRTAKDIANWWHGEADWWTTSNAIWWYKKAAERWWSLEDMSEWFFALLYSGCLYNVDQVTFLKIKALWEWDWMPIIMTRFSTTKPDMELFNETVLELSKKIQELYPQHNWIYDEALKLFNNAKSWKWKEKERFLSTIAFWRKHGTPIVRALNMVNKTDNDYWLTDKIIIFEKNKNDVFKRYYNNVRGYTDLDWAFWKWFIDEDFWEVWVTWLNVHKLTKKYLTLWNNRKFRDSMTWSRVWKEVVEDMISTKNKVFDTDKNLDRKKKEEYLVYILRELIWGFFVNMWWITIASYNDPTSETWKYFNHWKLDIWKDLWDFSSSDILKWWNASDAILLRTAKNILDWKPVDDDAQFDPISQIKVNTKNATDNTFNSPSNILP